MIQAKNKKTLLQRLNLIFLIVILSAMLTVHAYLFGDFIENLDRFIQGNIYVIVSKWDVPVFLCFPGYLALIVGLIFRLVDQDTEKRMDICTKIIIIFVLIFVFARVPYGFLTSYYLRSKGYTSCWELSRHQLVSPTVWVRNPGFCIENTGNVKNKILDWMDTLPNSGKDVSPDEVRKKSEDILSLYVKEQKKEYPHLYD